MNLLFDILPLNLRFDRKNITVANPTSANAGNSGTHAIRAGYDIVAFGLVEQSNGGNSDNEVTIKDGSSTLLIDQTSVEAHKINNDTSLEKRLRPLYIPGDQELTCEIINPTAISSSDAVYQFVFALMKQEEARKVLHLIQAARQAEIKRLEKMIAEYGG